MKKNFVVCELETAVMPAGEEGATKYSAVGVVVIILILKACK